MYILQWIPLSCDRTRVTLTSLHELFCYCCCCFFFNLPWSASFCFSSHTNAIDANLVTIHAVVHLQTAYIKKTMNCMEFSFLSCPFSLWINMNVPSSVTTAKLLKYWNAFERKTLIVLDVRFQIGKYRSRNTTWYSLVTTGKSENIWRIVTTLQLPSSVDKFYYWGELRQTMRKHLLHMGISISSKKKSFPF